VVVIERAQDVAGLLARGRRPRRRHRLPRPLALELAEVSSGQETEPLEFRLRDVALASRWMTCSEPRSARFRK
jgi:hypothetical protein